MESNTAIIAAASGSIGSSLLDLLLKDERNAQVITLVRSHLAVEHEKLQQQKIDFDLLDALPDFPIGDDIFCCLGTTQAKSKNEEDYRKVDFHYRYNLA